MVIRGGKRHGKGASSACIRAGHSLRGRHAHVLRDEQPPSRITSSAQCGKPRRRETGGGKREKERDGKGDCRGRRREGRERKKRGRGNDSERGEVAFNQSPASKCTVHVYVYRGGERRARGVGEGGSRRERYMVRLVFAREVAWKLAPN